MVNPDTDLLGAHRWKTLRTMLLAIVGVAVIGGGLFALVQLYQPSGARVDAAIPDVAVVDARPVDAPEKIDAENRDHITALSRFGFFSLAATAPTSIYIDNKLYGETPLTRLPMTPGVYKVKAVGPRGRVKYLKVDIYGGKETDKGTLTW